MHHALVEVDVIHGDAEELALPDDVSDVASLRAALIGRGGAWAQALSESTAVRAAVNQEMASPDTRIRDGDEVAFFPPVTGG